MYTVKQVDGRGWRIVTATRVSLDAVANVLTAHRPDPKDDEHFSNGHIYVMNDQGKTVSVYNLDKKEQQAHDSAEANRDDRRD